MSDNSLPADGIPSETRGKGCTDLHLHRNFQRFRLVQSSRTVYWPISRLAQIRSCEQLQLFKQTRTLGLFVQAGTPSPRLSPLRLT
jgi:hypothetical protein